MKAITFIFALLVMVGFTFKKEDQLNEDYFPMIIGKKNIYYSTMIGAFDCQYLIKKDTSLNDKKVFIVEYSYLDGHSRRDFVYSEKGNIFYKAIPTGPAQLYIPSADSINKDFIMVRDGIESKCKIVSVNDSIKTPKGKFRDLMNIYSVRITENDTIRENHYLKKGLGLVATKVNGTLVSYLVNVNQ